MMLLKRTLICVFGVMQCVYMFQDSKNIIFHVLYILVASLCSAFLKRINLYKVHRSEKRGML